jgi:hypothetical protein
MSRVYLSYCAGTPHDTTGILLVSKLIGKFMHSEFSFSFSIRTPTGKVLFGTTLTALKLLPAALSTQNFTAKNQHHNIVIVNWCR